MLSDCNKRTGYPLIFNIFVPRRIKNVAALRVAELLTLGIVVVLVFSLIATQIRDRAQQPSSKDWRELRAAGVTDLTATANCRCNNTNFSANQAFRYLLNDSDYAFCDGVFSDLTNYWGSLSCALSTYQLFGLISQGQWTLTSSPVLTVAQLNASINDQTQVIAFSDWNTLTESMLISGNLTAMMQYAVDGNETALAIRLAVLTQQYDEMNWAVWQQLPFLSAHMRQLVQIDYEQYLESCQPVNCYVNEPVPTTSMLLQIPSAIGGTLVLIATLFVTLFVPYEDRSIKKLVERFRDRYVQDLQQQPRDKNAKNEAKSNGSPALRNEDLRDLKLLANVRNEVLAVIYWQSIFKMQKAIRVLWKQVYNNKTNSSPVDAGAAPSLDKLLTMTDVHRALSGDDFAIDFHDDDEDEKDNKIAKG